jgi:hypothetical protein
MKSTGAGSRQLAVTILLVVLAVVLYHGESTAEVETWLCPYCQVERIEWEVGPEGFDCPSCETTINREDLGIQVAYLSIRTRPTEVVWQLMPECNLFRTEGVIATPKGGRLWVPWSAVDYYIPRQRILRLTSGEEFMTPYAQGPGCEKEEQPVILATLADSVGDFQKGKSIRTRDVEERMSTIFVIARSPAALDSGRVRFITEVEAGLHPRLPRTNPRALRLGAPTTPQDAMNDSLEVVLEVRIAEKGGAQKINRVKGSGNEEVDRAALVAAYRSSLIFGGEMGAGVPSSLVLRYHFNRGEVTVDCGKISSSLSRVSCDSFSSAAFRFSPSCSGCVTPTIVLAIDSIRRHQARAT